MAAPTAADPPDPSSLAAGVLKVAESVTGAGRLCPFSPTALRFARYADLAWNLQALDGNSQVSRL